MTNTERRRRKRLKGISIRLITMIMISVFIVKAADFVIAQVTENGNRTGYDKVIRLEAEAGSDRIASEDAILNDLPDNETADTLQSMVKQDERIKNILEHYNDYPEELLEMLSRNIEMLDFVLDYPEKKGTVYDDTIGDIEKGSVPLLLQWDEGWGYGDYGDSSIAISGCGPTSLSMVIAKLTGENDVTPYTVAQFAEENGYYVAGSGTSWDLFTEGSRHFGVQGDELSLSEASIKNALQSGCPILCSMGPGDFTTTGHIIVLTGIKDGKFTVCDPNSTERSNELWDYQTLERQIRNLWSFTAL